MPSNKKNPSVVIIGAGMTGIGAAIKFKEQGINDITLLEKKDSIGGTWRENRYPGVACDVPAHAYTYSFEPNPDWSGLFAPGDEIKRYFEKVFLDYGVDKKTHFNEAVVSCHYSDGQWKVTTSKGNIFWADIVIAATGMLHHPVTPTFKGQEGFSGASFHSAQWDNSFNLSGKRIGVIGTGSSGAQLIPELINRGDTEVTVFQRTPQWLVEVPNKKYTDKQKKQFADNPARIERTRKMALWVFEKGTTALTSQKWFDRLMHKAMAWNAKRYLSKAIKNKELRDKLTPDYTFGCKRVVLNATFYDAIQKPNAHLITEGIEEFVEAGIKTKDGKLHELDLIVYATGFNPLSYMRPMDLVGREGVAINDAWQDKVTAYRSLCIPGFPNFFLMLGPNSPIGNYSVISISEIQLDWVLKLVDQWRNKQLETIEVKPEAVAQWNAMLKEKMSGTVWASGCSSWYLDADGDPVTWPDTWQAWKKEMLEPNLDDFYSTEPKN